MPEPTVGPPADLLTVAQIARRTGKSVRTIHRWVRTGKLVPVAKLDGHTGHYLFAPDALAHIEDDHQAAS